MILPLVVLAILSAQPVPGMGLHVVGSFSVDGTTVIVQSTEGDGEVNEQVARLVPGALRAATRWGPLPASVVLTVHATHAGLESATGRAGNPWMRAWARAGSVDLQSPRTWSRGRASDQVLGQILAHEFTHCALFRATGREGRARGVPLWFQEGMASVAAGEHHDASHVDAVTSPGSMLRFDPGLVYGTADRAFRELIGSHGEDAIRRVITRLGEGHAFPAAFRDGLGVPLADFEGDLVRRLSALAVSN